MKWSKHLFLWPFNQFSEQIALNYSRFIQLNGTEAPAFEVLSRLQQVTEKEKAMKNEILVGKQDLVKKEEENKYKTPASKKKVK